MLDTMDFREVFIHTPLPPLVSTQVRNQALFRAFLPSRQRVFGTCVDTNGGSGVVATHGEARTVSAVFTPRRKPLKRFAVSYSR
jgi:hypothetical protein